MKRSRSIAVLAVLTILLLYVTERIGVVKVGYDIERLKEQRAKLERERDEMKVKLSSLTAPERIARVATEQLGMAPPKPGQVVLVRVGADTMPAGGAPAPTVKLARYEPGRTWP
jgi:cell division protein FtsL